METATLYDMPMRVRPLQQRSGNKHPEWSMECVGKRLRATRLALGLKAIDFCKRAGDINRSTYSQWESGSRMPAQPGLNYISEAHDVSLDWLLMGRLDKLDRDLAIKVLDLLQNEIEGGMDCLPANVAIITYNKTDGSSSGFTE